MSSGPLANRQRFFNKAKDALEQLRFTVAVKLALGVALIVMVGSASMIVIYRGLNTVSLSLDQLAKTKEPASAAAYEIEIQLHAIGFSVLRYMDAASPSTRDELKSLDANFKNYLDRYVRLSESTNARELAKVVGDQYDQYKTLADDLIARKDEQERLLARIADNFESLDKVIHSLEAKIRRDAPGFVGVITEHRKVEALLKVEAESAEIGLWLSHYQRERKREYRERIFLRGRVAFDELRKLSEITRPQDERSLLSAIEKLLGDNMQLINQVLSNDDRVRGLVKKFSALGSEIDHRIDNEMQVAANQALTLPTRNADAAADAVIQWIRFLLPLFFLSAIGAAWVLYRLINKPVQALAQGTQAVAQGDLTYRLRSEGRDEFSELATNFNRMVEKLETTTVSRQRLVASEQTLQATVHNLRREIEARKAAQEEQARLQASLRRSETMAAMGSLVAGVAHQVRNPIFGISSVVDAMEARLGPQDACVRYIQVLRAQADRVSRIVRDLFEYGRPPLLDYSPGSIVDAIKEAACNSHPLAEQAGVHVSLALEAGAVTIPIDQARLTDAFENLIENAIQHSPRGTTVSVEARRAGENGQTRIQVAVKDSGPGIAAEDLPHLFEPFFSRRQGGTGLGLAIVQRIVEQHEGEITATNRPEGGAMILVSFHVPGDAAQILSEKVTREKPSAQ